MSVTWTSNAGELAARKRRMAETVRRGFARAAKEHGDKMRSVAVALSSGTVTPADRRRMRSRFTPRFPAGFGPMPDAQINVVTGVFRASWRVSVQQSGQTQTIRLSNLSPEAVFLLGDGRRPARPTLAEVERRTAGDLAARVGRVIRKAGSDG